MALMPLEEAKAQLVTVNAAIESVLNGKRLKELRVGSDRFLRLFSFTETPLKDLLEYRNELLQIIDSYESATPTFRTNATIPLISTKGY